MEKVVQIRTLAGESIVIKAPPDRSIGDLKLLLKESFLPAKNCPNFHLFLKIGTIDDSAFLVFVPFTKKRQHAQSISSTANQDAMSEKPVELSHASASVWQDIMSDVSSLSDIPQSATNLKNINSGCSSSSSSSAHVPLNKKSKLSFDNKDLIKEILDTDMEDTFNQKFGDAMQQLLDSVSCLSHGNSGSCLLFSELFRMSSSNAKCACPSWLKRLIKIFTVLNLFYGVIQMKSKRSVNWGYLECVLGCAPVSNE